MKLTQKWFKEHDIKFKKEGDSLIVGGGLDLQNAQITSLPENLTVGGGLYLQGTKITSLPENLTVGGSLYLQGTQIKELPKNLTVGSYLDLRNTQLTSLPENLTVGGYLDLRNTEIKELPATITVGGSLYLRNSQITALPTNLNVSGYLDLQDTQITNKKVKKPPKEFMEKFKNDLNSRIKLTLNLDSKLTWQNGKYRKIDGIFCEVVKSIGKFILKAKVQNKTVFIFNKNNIYAHGTTVKKAYRDWLFKTYEKDLTKYEKIKLEEQHDINYWYAAYRAITGACSFGTENFIDNNQEKIKSQMSLKEVLDITQNQYRHNVFKDFFEEKGVIK